MFLSEKRKVEMTIGSRSPGEEAVLALNTVLNQASFEKGPVTNDESVVANGSLAGLTSLGAAVLAEEDLPP